MNITNRCTIIAGLLAASSCLQAQPNLLVNPGFDVDLDGWEIAFGRPAVWDVEDVLSASDSGSALLTNVEPFAGGFLTILRQCVPIPGPGSYRIAGWVRNLPDQPVPGSASIIAQPARFADCTGGFANSFGTQAVTSTTWQYREAAFAVSHDVVPYAAIQVSLAVLKAQAVATPRSAWFDEIELVSLEPLDPIFANDFEITE